MEQRSEKNHLNNQITNTYRKFDICLVEITFNCSLTAIISAWNKIMF